ncbi:MAG TPA: trigger factor, partial [Acidimicrobiales bacterium]|nr:trigger factor [Acidimicrobiales bacterium]
AALRGEALREALPDFYARAVHDTDLDPIDRPEIDITAGDESGPVTFDALVPVRPTVSVAGYQGLVVTVPRPEVAEDEVQAQLDRLRATTGELVEVTRPARDGDQVTIDVHGAVDAGGESIDADDFLYEVGSGSAVPGLDDQLRGSRVGDILSFEAPVAPSGLSAAVRVLVKEVKELVLPEVTDEWAAESSEFETVEELKADIAARLRERKVLEARIARQQGAMAALVELVTEDVPDALVDSEVRERLHDLEHRLEQQGLSLAQFLAATNQSEAEFVAQLREGAVESVKADLALRAVADAEGIEVTDEELESELAAMGERLGTSPEAVRERLERSGRLSAVRSERRKIKAARWLVEHVELVDEQGSPVAAEELDAGEPGEDEEADERDGGGGDEEVSE